MAISDSGESVHVSLLERHVACLERLRCEIQAATGAEVGMSAIIRALVEALDEAGGIDPAPVSSEEDLVDVFYRRFVGQADPPRDRERMRRG